MRAGSLCANLRAEYAEASLRAQRCTIGAPGACQLKSRAGVGCAGPCLTWVNDAGGLAELATRFQASGCEACLYGSPTGDRCHPFICPALGVGSCVAGAGGQGTCVNTEPDCPPGTMAGMSCSPLESSCRLAANRSCICSSRGGWLCP